VIAGLICTPLAKVRVELEVEQGKVVFIHRVETVTCDDVVICVLITVLNPNGQDGHDEI